jgi:putative tricarboxylic transport membrane protein
VSEGDATVLFGSALTVTLYALLVLGLIWVAASKIRARQSVDI